MALNGPCSPDSLSASNKSKTYATVAADIDIVALGGGPARRIRIGGAGNLNVDYGNGVTDIIPALLAGDIVDVAATKILLTSTTVTNVTIFW